MFLRRYINEMYAWKVNKKVNPKMITIEQNLYWIEDNWDLIGEVWIPHGFHFKEHYSYGCYTAFCLLGCNNLCPCVVM